jgi:hypothetical protein
MKLSKWFTLAEMIESQTAKKLGIDNTPSPAIIEQLKYTCSQLDLVRDYLKCPIIVSSGYRCLKLNRAIGSKDTSQHPKGQAADMSSPLFGTPRQVVEAIIESGISFDQLILENLHTVWVHISFKKSGNRKRVLIIDKNGARPFK